MEVERTSSKLARLCTSTEVDDAAISAAWMEESNASYIACIITDGSEEETRLFSRMEIPAWVVEDDNDKEEADDDASNIICSPV